MASLALWLAALWLVSGSPLPRPRAVLWVLGLAVFGLLSLTFLVADQFTAVGIDQSVVFHLQLGLDGAGFGDYLGLMAATAAVLIGMAAFCVWLYLRLVQGPIELAQAAPERRASAVHWLPVSLVLVALGVHPAVLDVGALLHRQWQSSGDAQPSAHYRLPKDLEWASQRNLVLIYLESLERSFLDERRFPGLTPHLRRLQAGAIDFSDVRQLEGSGWTIAGMVASQCGVPLLTLLHGNDMAGTDRFMSEATCLGDLLKAQGYRMNYMGGAELDFAGKGRFYETHGFERVEGLGALRDRLPDPNRVNAWGLYDDDLMRLVAQRHAELAAQGGPFGLVLLTLDTHPPEGHLSPACGGLKYGDGRNPMLNAVHCTDKLVGALVDELMAHPGFQNAVIWIASDHLAMPNTATQLLEKGPRRNLLMALAPDQVPRQVDLSGSTLDTGATILQSLGATDVTLAYGRSLLSDKPTLVQTLGQDGANIQLIQDQGFLASLWRHPQLTAGVRLLDDQSAVLGARTLRFPMLMLVDEAMRVTRVSLGEESTPEVISKLAPVQRFVWLDLCERVYGLAVAPADRPPHSPERPHCLAVGSMGSQAWWVFSPVPGEAIGWVDLRRAFGALQDDPQVVLPRRQRAEHWMQYGHWDLQVHRVYPGGGGSAWITVIGGPNASSVVRFSESSGESVLPLNRGITVLGFDARGAPHKLAYRDTCGDDGGQAITDGVSHLERLNPESLASAAPGAVAVVVHDSAVCGGQTLASLEGVQAFPRLHSLGLREPYVGIVDALGQVHEFTASPEGRIALQLENLVPTLR